MRGFLVLIVVLMYSLYKVVMKSLYMLLWVWGFFVVVFLVNVCLLGFFKMLSMGLNFLLE